MARHVRKGDTVMVIAGDYKGRTGKVLRVDPKKGKVVVEGINRVYRHTRPNRHNPQGGRLQKEAPIDLSNVLPISPRTNRPTRVRFQVDPQGRKVRVSARCGSELGEVSR